MIKVLPKAPLKSRQVNANFHGNFGHRGINRDMESKTPLFHGTAEAETLQLSPAIPSPNGGGVANDWCITFVFAAKVVQSI